MNPITVNPLDLTGQLILRESIAEGEYAGKKFTVDMSVNAVVIINCNGMQVGVSIRSLLDQLLPVMAQVKEE